MPEEFEDVVEHVKAHAGEALEAIVVYDETRHRDIYRREDIDALHDSDLEKEVLEDVRADRRQRESAEASKHEGEHRASAHVFDERVILHLPRDGETGTILILDTTAARNLTEFVADIRSDIYDE
ncbi:hypothetical protein [Halorhabdus rudnickae]|uniref:hypothetical protein n=1 Tax=Halorhabdus rudnickae TaxID=1775544 RepID=UPI00108437F6|nr:hypothetical protein [Halorhabdus rudnickae]